MQALPFTLWVFQVSDKSLIVRLSELATKYKMTDEEQLHLIYSGLNGVGDLQPQVSAFHAWLDVVEEELGKTAMLKEESAGTPKSMTADHNSVAAINAFFDRNLARRALARLVQLPSDGPVFERVGYNTARLVVPQAEMALYKEHLEKALPFECDNGEIVAGWYTVFSDGSTGAIAIVNAASEDGGPFVDAFLILPEGVHPTVSNPSLDPTRDLQKDFVFPHPDGTYRVIRLTARIRTPAENAVTAGG